MTRNRRVAATLAAALALLLLPCASVALAHAGHHEESEAVGPRNWHELWRTWGLEPGSMIGLALSAWLYARGVRRLWAASGHGRGVRPWEAACFAGGWFALFVALVSPLHPWGRVLFSAHMTQHEVLMLVAAPLLVLGRPLVVFAWALPLNWARAIGRATNRPGWQRFWVAISNPLAAWVIHAVALWAWHVPALFQATLEYEWVHAAQHLSFLMSAALFWWAVMHGRNRAVGFGAAVLYLFTTALHNQILGALLTFAKGVWYPAYLDTTQSWGLTPLEDQQLGGLVMWIPAGVVYIIAGLALVAGWMRDSERRVQRREARERTAATEVSDAVPAGAGAGGVS
jgi:cytochrome c oxidase assembly factor CtaG